MIPLIAIDPGNNGGICTCLNGQIVCHKMPETPMDILDLIRTIPNGAECMIEKVHGMPGQGGGAMFTFGRSYGWLEMALLALEIPTHTVSPQRWQKQFNLGTKSQCQTGTEWKNKLKAKAQQLHPNVKVTLWSADALLIMDYFKTVKGI